MCGRYALCANKKQLVEAIALALPETIKPDYNIGPGREVLSVSNDLEKAPRASFMHWGLKTPQNFHINARIETADTAPRFRESWEHHRCLIPASGFYEWYADGVTKQPYYIYPEDRGVSFLAGLWYPSANGEYPDTCIILPTTATETVNQVHHRMPVILKLDAGNAWLNNDLSKAETISLANATPFKKHTVSRRVNSVKNNDCSLIEATTPLNDDQMMLF